MEYLGGGSALDLVRCRPWLWAAGRAGPQTGCRGLLGLLGLLGPCPSLSRCLSLSQELFAVLSVDAEGSGASAGL